MKHKIDIPQKKHPLATAVLLASGLTIGLSGCGADQYGDTNDGLISGTTGVFGNDTATSLLLLGGVVGAAALLDSDNDSGALVVNTAGNDAVAGGDTTGDDTANNGDTTTGGDTATGDNTGGDTGGNTGDGSDSGSDSTDSNGNNDGDGTGSDGNASDNNGDTDSTGNDTQNIPEGTPVEFLQPPDWLRGMWQGTASDGTDLMGYGGATAMGTASPGQPIGPYSDIPGARLQVLQNTDSVFEYTVTYPREDGTEAVINEQWEFIDDGSVLYTVSGTNEDQFIMYNTPAADFLQPPNWLQGQWQGDDTAAYINDSNIVYGNGSAQKNYYNLLSHDNSVFQLRQNDDNTYSIKITTYDSQGGVIYIIDTFTSTGNNSLTLTSTVEGFQPVTMTRQ